MIDADEIELFDTHCHLYEESLTSIQVNVLQRAAEQGVRSMLCVGTTVATSLSSIHLATTSQQVYAAVGIHPNYAQLAGPHDWSEITQLAATPRVVALGETGLDRYWNDCPFAIQQDYFERHLELSHKTRLPFVTHMRDCEADVLEMLRRRFQRYGVLTGIMHSFAGSLETMQECVAMGMHISFAGMLTYKKSESLRHVAALVPNDRLLVETDSPYLSPHPVRSQRPNEPALMVHTAQCLADARRVSLREIGRITTANARKLFGLKV